MTRQLYREDVSLGRLAKVAPKSRQFPQSPRKELPSSRSAIGLPESHGDAMTGVLVVLFAKHSALQASFFYPANSASQPLCHRSCRRAPHS